MQMYKCCILVNARFSQTPRQRLRSCTSLVVPPATPHEPRKQASRAQQDRSALHPGNVDAVLQPGAYEQQSRPPSTVKGSLNAHQLLQAHQYMELLMTQNAKMNLTAAADTEAAFQMHVEDSLALLPALDAVSCEHAQSLGPHDRDEHQDFRIIDVGSGGGLPGVIIAIARPNWKVTLLDSLRKRCHFVEVAVQQVGLQNTQVVWARAEEAGQSQQHREMYDVAIARAVARMGVLSELCLPMVKPGGHWLAAKGPDCQEEVAEAEKAIAILQGKVVSVNKVDAFGSAGQHTAVLVKKLAHTPAQYPRRPGKPNKRPL